MHANYFVQKAQAIHNKLVQYRRHIHQNPELSFEEFNTSKFIQNKLEELNIEYKLYGKNPEKPNNSATGVLAQIGNGGKVVGLRADIDALPLTEETGLTYKSQNEGVMHACGHDMHTSMLLGVAEILKNIEDDINGTVLLIFQPAEEKLPGGAKVMLEEGIFDDIKPDIMLGQHIDPQGKLGTLAACSGSTMASTDELHLTIKGKGSHAAQPHLGNDPILTAAQIVIAFQTLINKNRNPLDPGVLTIASLNAGNTTNIFPENAYLKGTLRTYNNEWRFEMHEHIKKTIRNICDIYGCDYELNIAKGYLPLINDQDTTNFVKTYAVDVFGKGNVLDFEPKMWAEDFAYFADKIPSTFFYLGVKPNDTILPGLHNPKLAPSEDALSLGTANMAYLAYKYLTQ